MKIIYCVENDVDKNGFIKIAQNSMIDYLKSSEHQLPIVTPSNDIDLSDCDLVIFYGIYSRALHQVTQHKKLLYDKLVKAKKGLLIIEKGFINRKQYYSIGFNSNVGYGYYHNANSPDDRFKQLKCQLKPNTHQKNGYILLCGQIPHDSQIQHLTPEQYLEFLQSTVDQIKKVSQRQIVFRGHPKYKKQINLLGAIPSKNPKLIDDLRQAYAVVGFNSNSLLEAMMEGYPVFVLDRGSVVYPIANHDLTQIENTATLWANANPKDKYQIFSNIAYAQWNATEIRNGKAFKHIIKGYSNAIERLGKNEPNFSLE